MASFGLSNSEGLQAAAEWLAYDAALKGLDIADAGKRLVSEFGEWVRPYTDQIVEAARAYHPTVQQELKEQFGVDLGEFGTSADEAQYGMDAEAETPTEHHSQSQPRDDAGKFTPAPEPKLAAPAQRLRRTADTPSQELQLPPLGETQERVPPMNQQNTTSLSERITQMPTGSKIACALFAILLIAITIVPPIGEASTYGRCVFTGYHFLFSPPKHDEVETVLDTHRIILEIILAAAVCFVFSVVYSLINGKAQSARQ